MSVQVGPPGDYADELGCHRFGGYYVVSSLNDFNSFKAGFYVTITYLYGPVKPNKAYFDTDSVIRKRNAAFHSCAQRDEPDFQG